MMTKKARRQRGTEAWRARGFSLVEVLMSIFILGIGIISIAALFPAGIAQQRQSVDDILGPTVAANALSVLRTRLDQHDFGACEDFGAQSPRYTVPGDWSWLRPAFIFPGANNLYPLGAIDIFNGTGSTTNEFDSGGAAVASGIPYNRTRYGFNDPADRPVIIIPQQERYYPQGSYFSTAVAPRPQYVWDCAFRRYQGRVLAAIFVYRVTYAGGEPQMYTIGANASDPTVPPLPVWNNLANANQNDAWDSWGLTPGNTLGDDTLLYGSECGVYDPFNIDQSWQEGGQWMVDQNNNVHRVLSASCDDQFTNTRRLVELTRPAPAMPIRQTTNVAVNYSAGPNFDGVTNIVTDIWYLPVAAPDANGTLVKLTPVYLLVEEL